MRRWEAGIAVRLPNAPTFRVVPGNKAPGDLRLDWFSSRQRLWIPVQMSAAALITDFWYENEDHLYPPSRGKRGGKYFLDYLQIAAIEGWETADRKLRREQRFRRFAA